MLLVDFYLARSPDHADRLITDIWAFSLDQIEYTHDYIQWLFPLDTPSPVNPFAPTLDAASIAEFRRSQELQSRLLRSFDMMLRFYGFERIAAAPNSSTPSAYTRTPDFSARAANWLSTGNHNHLRLTRILHCLTLCGLESDARALLDQLLSLARSHAHAISPTTLTFWRNALHP